ncbi:MAG TPA: phosphate signaling complex protein PhoU, partial [Thermodesulfovibrionales bacterium]|nr:phosphate signaling complex protein PhoU [Thermodesulfovibrionales bacterium]
RNRVLRLGSMVERAIQDSVKSLVEGKSDLAKKVIKRDQQINALDIEIDKESIRLLSLGPPKARDLRFIVTTLKITTDIERMGDLAVNIAERAIELNKEPQLKPYIDIPRMAEIVQEMVGDSLDAYVKGCTSLPYKVLKMENEIDKLMEQVFNELLFFMIQDPRTASRAIRIISVAKYLERIADHATNVAEMVIYMCEGKLVRHVVVTE